MKIVSCILMLATAMPLHAETRGHASFIFENDAFLNQDNGFTNGIAFQWGYAPFDEFDDSYTPSWIQYLTEDLYISTMPDKHRAIGYFVFQDMDTPNDISKKELQEDDVPYAGVLGWTVTQHAFDEKVSDNLSLTLGIVGPLSLAEQSQTVIHEIINADQPQGWDNQIRHEPVFRLAIGRNWRLLDALVAGDFGFDVIALSQAGIGNLVSDVNAGLTFRLGTSLHKTFPTIIVIPSKEFNLLAASAKNSFHLYFSAVLRYVANDIRIEGNTFKDSHYQELKHEQYVVTAGLNVNIAGVAVSLSYIDPSMQFEGQSTVEDPFGELAVSWTF
ncbi:MAG: lipid A deacylase LpxR family protein [Proteobacteria bacterium]|nr:lipid A deacylase LpxR family protein [Pseudomonadota bacterium]